MRSIYITILLLVTTLIQSTYPDTLKFFNTTPNFVFILVISYTLLRGMRSGMTFAFFAGMLQDIVLGRTLGAFAIIYMIIAYLVGYTFKNVYRRHLVPYVVNAFAFTFVYNMIFYIFNFLLLGEVDFTYYFVNIMLTEAVYNTIVILIVFIPLYNINLYIEEREKPTRNVFKL